MSAPASLAEQPAQAPPAASVPDTQPHSLVERCQNCGNVVTQRYCGACGQRLDAPLHSLWHFGELALEDLTHADSRIWRTLTALLFKPGFLTREFLHGRRARYLPPLRLYLVVSLAFFLYASTGHHDPRVIRIGDSNHVPTAASVTSLDAEKNRTLAARAGESPEQRAQRVCNDVAYDGPFRQLVLWPLHQVCVRSVIDNGRTLSEAFMHALPRAMFVFLPLLAAVMTLLYRRPRHYYVEHLLLFVHNHAFVFLLLLLAGLTSAVLPLLSGWTDLAVMLYIAWYVYRSMRVVYGQGRALTLGKLAALSFFYLVSGSIMLALTVVYSAFT
jgi:hypothetical protein